MTRVVALRRAATLLLTIGATGLVGRTMIAVLEERRFPVATLRPLASKADGRTLRFNGRDWPVEEARPEAFDGVDIALFSAGGSVSRDLAPEAAKRGVVVIDNSSQWRMDPDVPLIVPEVNAAAVEGFRKKNIIANPNCSTAQLVVALKPLHDKAKIKRVVVSTYQSVSGAGKDGMDELDRQTKALYSLQDVEDRKSTRLNSSH